MFHEDIFFNSYCKYIKLNFWLVICIAKNFIWTTLKAIFSIFRYFFCTPLFQICKKMYLRQILSDHNKPYINGKLCLKIKLRKISLMTGFVVQCHISENVDIELMCCVSNYVSWWSWNKWFAVIFLHKHEKTWNCVLHEHRLVSFSLIVVF